MGQNGSVVGQVPHFGPFPLKNKQKGLKEVSKRVENQVRFSACQTKNYSCRVLKKGPG